MIRYAMRESFGRVENIIGLAYIIACSTDEMILCAIGRVKPAIDQEVSSVFSY